MLLVLNALMMQCVQQLGHCRADITLGMPGQCFHAMIDNPWHVII